MNKETRIQKIEEIINQGPYTQKEIMWQDSLQVMDVYKIPLRYLIYNKYNGRILSRTKSLESQGGDLNPENEYDKKIIEKLLWDSKPDRNKKTKADIEQHGQKEIGIITKDGIIIDGNRRAMLLNQIDRFNYFKAVILPVTLEENPIEIEKLETSYQMGEDEKLGYNPIEKYLKAKTLKQKGVSKRQISDWMGESETTIEEYLNVMDTMDDYLDYLGYNSIYTQLDNREDQFINLTKWLKTFYGGGSVKAFDGYTDKDVDDLKEISFNYIRVKFEGKKFRYIGYGQKQNHFFGNKKIWESFRNKHFTQIEPIQDQEENPKLDTDNIQATLNSRDEQFRNATIKFLSDNLDEHYTQLRYKQAQNEPIKLVTNAKRAITAINIHSKNFEKEEVLSNLDELRNEITDMIQDTFPEKTLQYVLNLLMTIDIKKSQEDKDDLLDYIKQIEKEAYQLEKMIKKEL